MSKNIKFIVLIAIINIFNFNQIVSQNYNSLDVEFLEDNIIKDNLLAGGLLAPQFSEIDMNGDGIEDLFVFERAGNVVLTFINRGIVGEVDYYYDASYQEKFPTLNEFATLIDYNGDGLKDIFALSSQGVNGVEVWKNIGTEGDPSFEAVKFGQYSYDILYYRASGDFYTNLYVSNIDFPSITDIDDDGDIDIITFENDGSHIYLYKNLAKEMGLPSDTLVYDLVDKCYGLVYEGQFSDDVSLSGDGLGCPNELLGGNSGGSLRHAGSSLLCFDEDGDGVKDLLIGDLSNNRLVLLKNGRTSEDAWMTGQDTSFPSYDESADIDIFLGSFLIDADNDGKKDLIVAPNYDIGSDNINHIWFYKNVSTTDAYVFELQQKDFLVDRSILMGGFSNPCFIDYNADGLQDLLVGSDGIFTGGERINGLYLYENIGTLTTPRYQLIDRNYLNIGDLVNESTRLAPASGDIDNDGDVDLIIGNRVGYLFYYENIAGADMPVEYTNYVYQYMGVNPGTNLNPQIFDLDEDGLMDLIIGERNDNLDTSTMVFGGVNYFRNIGSKDAPQYDPSVYSGANTSALGGIYTRDIGETTTGESSPFFVLTDDKIKAVVGSKSGRVRLYDDISDNIYGLYNKAQDSLPVYDSGNSATVSLADIDNDDYYEMVMGNERGGLQFYNTDLKTDYNTSTVDPSLSENVILFPNPSSDYISINHDDQHYITSIEVKDIKGAHIPILQKDFSYINMTRWRQGIYIIKITFNDNQVVIKKIVKI